MTPEERYKMMHASMIEPAGRIKDFVPEGSSLLEVGCSSGALLGHLQKYNYDLYGSEWNAEDAAYLRDVGEIPCEEADVEDIYPGKTFTAIVAMEVLEHQPDPIAFLRKLKDRLIGGGYLYLEIPNANNALLTVYGIPEYKDFFYTEPHITYWTPETLAATLSSLGFESKVGTRQRYGLANHLNWITHHEPTPDYKTATDYMNFVSKEHPLYAPMARLTGKLDKEYRIQLETLKAADTIIASCRRRSI